MQGSVRRQESSSELVYIICMENRLYFFQAEDAIRDLTVTGVQTCALPILSALKAYSAKLPTVVPLSVMPVGIKPALEAVARSEERRVGKEGRFRWAPYH